ncbi:hypothetical protein FZC78_04735 [Rossellomorea vietnamensis]|uniref:Uncharacterized protein n=1 Tax=Rossellomorea vietnamensis TaxID=218284 RepID=A0A5D4NWT0_9BACI|nr:hypothetical protein FZC78_04735 [Rossellomorea vietnamensis]
MPVVSDQGASIFYAGAAEEAHRPPRGVFRLERKSISFKVATIFTKRAFLKEPSKKKKALEMQSLFL